MSPVVPRNRRPDQNTGRRAKTVREVETQPCPDRDGPHWLINRSDGTTECRGCGRLWADLDGELNQRGESWLTS